MNRRSFLASLAASASALVLPYEPKRVYSFMPGRLWVDERGELQKAGDGLVRVLDESFVEPQEEIRLTFAREPFFTRLTRPEPPITIDVNGSPMTITRTGTGTYLVTQTIPVRGHDAVRIFVGSDTI